MDMQRGLAPGLGEFWHLCLPRAAGEASDPARPSSSFRDRRARCQLRSPGENGRQSPGRWVPGLKGRILPRARGSAWTCAVWLLRAGRARGWEGVRPGLQRGRSLGDRAAWPAMSLWSRAPGRVGRSWGAVPVSRPGGLPAADGSAAGGRAGRGGGERRGGGGKRAEPAAAIVQATGRAGHSGHGGQPSSGRGQGAFSSLPHRSREQAIPPVVTSPPFSENRVRAAAGRQGGAGRPGAWVARRPLLSQHCQGPVTPPSLFLLFFHSSPRILTFPLISRRKGGRRWGETHPWLPPTRTPTGAGGLQGGTWP